MELQITLCNFKLPYGTSNYLYGNSNYLMELQITCMELQITCYLEIKYQYQRAA